LMAVLPIMLCPLNAYSVVVGRLHWGRGDGGKEIIESRFVAQNLYTNGIVHPQRWMVDFLGGPEQLVAWLHPQRFMRTGNRDFILVDGAGCKHFSQLFKGCNITGWDMEARRW
jgi:hypothetical protein